MITEQARDHHIPLITSNTLDISLNWPGLVVVSFWQGIVEIALRVATIVSVYDNASNHLAILELFAHNFWGCFCSRLGVILFHQLGFVDNSASQLQRPRQHTDSFNAQQATINKQHTDTITVSLTLHHLWDDTCRTSCYWSPSTFWSWDDTLAQRHAVGMESQGKPVCTQTQEAPLLHSHQP